MHRKSTIFSISYEIGWGARFEPGNGGIKTYPPASVIKAFFNYSRFVHGTASQALTSAVRVKSPDARRPATPALTEPVLTPRAVRRANIKPDDLERLKKLTAMVLSRTDQQIAVAVAAGEWREVKCDEEGDQVPEQAGRRGP